MAEQQNILLLTREQNSQHHITDILNKNNLVFLPKNSNDAAYQMLLEDPTKFHLVIINNDLNKQEVLDFLYKVNSCGTLKTTPIIVSEHHNANENDVADYIKSGGRYCLSYPIVEETAVVMVKSAIADHKRYQKMQENLHVEATAHPAHNMQRAEFKFQYLNEGQAIANLLAEAAPNPRLAIVGIAELLINAVEHGNLKISYKEKSQLYDQAVWLKEIEARIKQPENINKYVTVNFERTAKKIYITIKDAGDGFDWKKFQNIDNDRVYDNHGRGIVMAKNLAFEKLEYLGSGNEVKCTIPITPDTNE